MGRSTKDLPKEPLKEAGNDYGLLHSGHGAQKRKERPIEAALAVCALISVAAIAMITFMVFSEAYPAFKEIGLWRMLLGRSWRPTASNPKFGLLPMIAGSVLVTGLSLLIGVPIGLSSAIYSSELAPPWAASMMRRAAGMLSGIPSVVYGFFGLMVIVPAVRALGGSGMSGLSASLVLSVMILPTIIGVSEAAIRAVPEDYRQASLSLGATRWQTIWMVLLPAAKSGIVASVVLAVGRAVGETMAVMLVAGNIPIMPQGLLSGLRTLTVNIALEMGYVRPGTLHYSALFAAAAVLFAFIMAVNMAVRVVSGRGRRA